MWGLSREFLRYKTACVCAVFIPQSHCRLDHWTVSEFMICELASLTTSRHAWSFQSEAARLSPKSLRLGSSGEDEESGLDLGRLPLVATGLIWSMTGLLVWLVWLEGWWKL